MNVQLFTTLGCHLCEQAHEQLLELAGSGLDLNIELVEIADSDELMDQYGITIPVIRSASREIGWPFTVNELRSFLENSN